MRESTSRKYASGFVSRRLRRVQFYSNIRCGTNSDGCIYKGPAKRRYQLGMTDQVRQAMEKSNKKAYGRKKVLRFYDVRPDAKTKGEKAVCN